MRLKEWASDKRELERGKGTILWRVYGRGVSSKMKPNFEQNKHLVSIRSLVCKNKIIRFVRKSQHLTDSAFDTK